MAKTKQKLLIRFKDQMDGPHDYWVQPELTIETVRDVGAVWRVKFEAHPTGSLAGKVLLMGGLAKSASAAKARIRTDFGQVKILASEVTTDITVLA